ncbi:MAG: flavin oxidoreductase [Bacteroidia bacterium]|nr:MAG: flavin oxidoreductase [Bacteroidia bacterium]
MKFTYHQIIALDRLYRANLINSITGFKSVALLGTKSENGNLNLALFSQVFHVGANPPFMGVLFRPESQLGGNHSLKNVRNTEYFTLNHITANIYKQAHQTSARYAEDISEFDAVGLTPYFSENFFAPYVQQSPVKIGLKKEEEIPLIINGTTLIVASIQELIIEDKFIKADGFADLHAAGSITCSGLDAYLSTNKLARFSYAKPDKPIENISY